MACMNKTFVNFKYLLASIKEYKPTPHNTEHKKTSNTFVKLSERISILLDANSHTNANKKVNKLLLAKNSILLLLMLFFLVSVSTI